LGSALLPQSALSELRPLCRSYVVVMPKKRQALVEFEDILGACNAVNYAADNQIYIAGHPAFVNYSTSQKISRPGDSDDSRGVNNVLLFTILTPIYSITPVSWGGVVLRGLTHPGAISAFFNLLFLFLCPPLV